jgi:putative Mg2+ transporter-C (MgtC) family protein
MEWVERSWQTILHEFSDLGSPEDITRIILRLLVAVVLGGMLGYERESVGASAGLRTHMLVSLGAALFVLIPLQAGMEVGDLSRVLQGVTAGIGFIGAGAILKHSHKDDVKGVTTAASVWLTAAIGIAAGMGREATAVLSALFALVILAILKITPKDESTRATK